MWFLEYLKAFSFQAPCLPVLSPSQSDGFSLHFTTQKIQSKKSPNFFLFFLIMAWFLPSLYFVSSVQILFSFCGKLNLSHQWHSLSVLNPLYFHLESHFSIADYGSYTNILTACSSWLGCEAIFLNHGNNLFSMRLI